MRRAPFATASLVLCTLATATARSAGAQMLECAAHAAVDSARVVTSDVARFWTVFDTARVDDLTASVEAGYLDAGTPALRDYAARVGKAFDFAIDIYRRRARYEAARAATLRAAESAPAIRAEFRKLKSLYPDAVLPDVYFVIGRFSLGGAALAHGVVVGAELYPDPARLSVIVAHEAVHCQQPRATPDQTLLERAFSEGSADFVGEMISGSTIDEPAQAYGRAHEHELWAEFKPHAHEPTYYPWMYGKPPGDRPNDLGYFIGYRIARAYYERAKDKRRAVADIIRMRDVDEILRLSGYDP